MPRDLTSFFYPKSVAVIGASRSPEKVGAIILKNIIDSNFKGAIYPVNPKADVINNLKCFKDVASLPEAPNLAIIATPAAQVLEALDELGIKGTKNVVVIASGFKEVGADGKKLENDLISAAKKHNINLLGPNCLGFVNNLCPINTTFGELASEPGNLRFITQSGAIAASIFDWCKSIGLGFNEFITLGNKTVMNENDFLQYFLEQSKKRALAEKSGQKNMRPIGLYLESISNGGEFLRITNQITKKDPIFIIKPGKTKAGASAMMSHTGAIAGEDSILDAVLHQAGVIRCQTLEDFFDLARAFSWQDAPMGPKVAIISNAGGPAVISADAVIAEGLELAEFDDNTKKQLSEILPRSASIMNPIDVLGDALADRYGAAADIVLKNDGVHALLIILTPQIVTQIEKTAELIGGLSKKYKQPIFCSFIGGNLIAKGEQKLNEYKLPSFRFPERAIAALGAMWRFKKQRDKIEKVSTFPKLKVLANAQKIKKIMEDAKNSGQGSLDNFQANEILSAVGIATPPTKLVSNFVEATKFAKKQGWPVVLKISSPGLLHKKDIGGVITNIGNIKQLDRAWDRLERKITELDPQIKSQVNIQIQKNITEGIEVIVGVKKDSTFGWVMLFGAGGSLAELIADRNLHLLPIAIHEAKKLIAQSKAFTLLKGNESEPAYALDKLCELMVKLGKLAEIVPEATDLEINPVIVTLNNAWAIDGKVILESAKAKPVNAPKFLVATTLKNTVLSSTFHYCELKTEGTFVSAPGQYISVKVANDRINCYSIASRDSQDKLGLLVDTKPSGPGSKFFENVKPADKISFLGPFGIFTLKLNDGAKHLLFLGTGSGCAPLRRMIDAALKEHKTKLPITLYIGLNYVNDIFWYDYFSKLSKTHHNFNFKIAIFKPDKTWKGETGFITELVKKDFPDARYCAAYLCGNKFMIADATKILLDRGCPKERIYTEKFE